MKNSSKAGFIGSAGALFLIFGFLFVSCDNSTNPAPPPTPLEKGKVLILQVYGSGEGAENDGNISHSFVELYNVTDAPVSLEGASIQYRSDYSSGEIVADAAWSKLDLDGVIPANSSYLVLGKRVNVESKAVPYFSGPNLTLNDGDADQRWENKVFSNQGFKIVLLNDTALLAADVNNPFSMDGEKAPGYIDMIGVKNGKNVALTGYEGTTVPDSSNGAYQFISKQKSARRKSLADTDDNNEDFESIAWQPANMLNYQKTFYQPKNTAYGSWNPADVPTAPAVPSSTVLILQAYGNKGKASAAVSHSFVELYNTTNAAIDLSDYSLQYSEGGTGWEKLGLTGTIPARASFLVRGKAVADTEGGSLGDAAGLDLTNVTPDQSWDLGLSAVQFKLCLLRTKELLTVANPFRANNGQPVAYYTDMFGAFDNDAEALTDFDEIIDGYEGDIPAGMLSKQKSVRRKSLIDHNENAYDFDSFDYRDKDIDSKGNTDEDRVKFGPRTSAAGAYTPEF